MSYYSDCYYEANKKDFEREKEAEECRKTMVDELPINDMTRIMFADFLDKKSDQDVIKLAEKIQRRYYK